VYALLGTAESAPLVDVAPVPAMPWKEQPAAMMRGTATLAGAPMDGAMVRLEGASRVTAETDGNGYFGAVDLPTGAYAVTVTHEGALRWRGSVELIPGRVTTLDVSA